MLMFISIKKYKIKFGKSLDIVQEATESFYPLVQKLEGFRKYYVLCDDDHLVTVSIFTNSKGGIEANRLALEWMIEHAKKYVDGKPYLVTGIPIVELTPDDIRKFK
jgi:hypothetical protein